MVQSVVCNCRILQVEDSWKSIEFIVLSHRDQKDVFILGGTDDIQVVLDDSQVSLNITMCPHNYIKCSIICPYMEHLL